MRHARENPELYEDPTYSLRDELYRQADERRIARKEAGANEPRRSAPNSSTAVPITNNREDK